MTIILWLTGAIVVTTLVGLGVIVITYKIDTNTKMDDSRRKILTKIFWGILYMIAFLWTVSYVTIIMVSTAS